MMQALLLITAAKESMWNGKKWCVSSGFRWPTKANFSQMYAYFLYFAWLLSPTSQLQITLTQINRDMFFFNLFSVCSHILKRFKFAKYKKIIVGGFLNRTQLISYVKLIINHFWQHMSRSKYHFSIKLPRSKCVKCEAQALFWNFTFSLQNRVSKHKAYF